MPDLRRPTGVRDLRLTSRDFSATARRARREASCDTRQAGSCIQLELNRYCFLRDEIHRAPPAPRLSPLPIKPHFCNPSVAANPLTAAAAAAAFTSLSLRRRLRPRLVNWCVRPVGEAMASQEAYVRSGGEAKRIKREVIDTEKEAELEAKLVAKVIEIVFKTKPLTPKTPAPHVCVPGIMTEAEEDSVIKNATVAQLTQVRSEVPLHRANGSSKEARAEGSVACNNKDHKDREWMGDCNNKDHKDREWMGDKVLKIGSPSLRLAPPRHGRLGKSIKATIESNGVYPTVTRGNFSVPSLAISRVDAVNKKNLALARSYTTISVILKVKHISVIFSRIKGEVDTVCDNAVKAAVSEIRTLASALRREIAELGGKPLKEPLEYWRKTYCYAIF